MPKIGSESISIIILGLAGAFVFASLYGGGDYLGVALWFFLYAIVAAYTKQVFFKDRVSFARDRADEKTPPGLVDHHETLWRRHYIFQLGLFLVLMVLIPFIAISLGLISFPTTTEKDGVQSQQEFSLSMKDKCREVGEKAHEQIVRDAGQFTEVLKPKYAYNKELDTCLYSSGIISPDVTQQWVTDSFTNEELVSLIIYAGEPLCPTCLTLAEFKDKQRGLMGF